MNLWAEPQHFQKCYFSWNGFFFILPDALAAAHSKNNIQFDKQRKNIFDAVVHIELTVTLSNYFTYKFKQVFIKKFLEWCRFTNSRRRI